MRTRRRANIEDLQAGDRLPAAAHQLAMLEGIDRQRDHRRRLLDRRRGLPDAGRPPRRRPDQPGLFAKAWDRFAFRDSPAPGAPAAPPSASSLILRAHLRGQPAGRGAPGPAPATRGRRRPSTRRSSPAAAASTTASRRPIRRQAKRSRRSEPRPGDPSRARELRGRRGWAWSRVVRRYDDYERVLRAAAEAERAPPSASRAEQATRAPEPLEPAAAAARPRPRARRRDTCPVSVEVAATSPPRPSGSDEHPVELLWDLVFVFAITQVDDAARPSNRAGVRFGEAMLALALVWWAWSAFVWAANAQPPDSRALRAACWRARADLHRRAGAAAGVRAEAAPVRRRLRARAAPASGAVRRRLAPGQRDLAAIAGFAVTVVLGMAMLVAGGAF